MEEPSTWHGHTLIHNVIPFYFFFKLVERTASVADEGAKDAAEGTVFEGFWLDLREDASVFEVELVWSAVILICIFAFHFDLLFIFNFF